MRMKEYDDVGEARRGKNLRMQHAGNEICLCGEGIESERGKRKRYPGTSFRQLFFFLFFVEREGPVNMALTCRKLRDWVISGGNDSKWEEESSFLRLQTAPTPKRIRPVPEKKEGRGESQ